MNRKIIRLQINTKRQQLTFDQRFVAAQKIKANLDNLTCWLQSQNIAAYLPFHGEVDVMPIIEDVWKMGKNCYLPILPDEKNNPLLFGMFARNSPLKKNKFDIYEPPNDPLMMIDAKNLDLAIVPLVGFDEHCNRLGQGCAYYDRTFAFKLTLPKNSKPILIGVAYELQKINALEKNEWDVAMDLIITEENIYHKT